MLIGQFSFFVAAGVLLRSKWDGSLLGPYRFRSARRTTRELSTVGTISHATV
jgi:hypothetical protein